MKKQYTTPALDIVSLESPQIIITSIGVGDGPSTGDPQLGKQRNAIWDEDE